MSPSLSRVPARPIRPSPTGRAALHTAFSGTPENFPGSSGTTRLGNDTNDVGLESFSEPDHEKKLAGAFGHKPLSLNPLERSDLESAFGTEALNECLEYDVFSTVDALRRQLAYEQKSEMSATQFYRIDPACMPTGWHAEDTKIDQGGGLISLRTIFRGPAGECGKIMRSFDGCTLHLDEAYKSSLPSKLVGVPGFDHPVATINYMTARACRLLDMTADKLGSVKVNRLQHRPMLVHLDWLQYKYPQKSLAELIGHTTWAKQYVRQAAANIGHTLEAEPEITFQSSPEWIAAHPGVPERDWAYTRMEAQRLAIEHMTGHEIVEVDDPLVNWEISAAKAIERFKEERCVDLSESNATIETERIDRMISVHLGALEKSETALTKRYGVPPDYAPRHMNFDVTFRTRRIDER